MKITKNGNLDIAKFLVTATITALFLICGNAVAVRAASDSSLGVAEQMQTQTATGLVTDANGEPIIGASVIEKGTTNGTITDFNGKFTLNVKAGPYYKSLM